MNPFEKVDSPNPLSSRESLIVEPPFNKGGNEGGFENRRSELKPHVRDYADKLYVRLLDIYKKYGAKDAEGMRRNVLSGNGPKLEKADVAEIDFLLGVLDSTLSKGLIPESVFEVPPLEALKGLVEKMNRQVAPGEVFDLGRWDDYEFKEGEINGLITIMYEDHTDIQPVVKGELIQEVDGQHIEEFKDLRVIDGNINGCAFVDRKWLPVMDGHLIRELGGRGIINCIDVRNVDGLLNGGIAFEESNGRPIHLPVIQGRVITHLNGQRIVEAADIHCVDGELNGRFNLDEDFETFQPVINGKIVDLVSGEDIHSCREIHNTNGKLNGRVEVSGGWFPVIDGEIIYEIDGIKLCGVKHCRNINGKMNGQVFVSVGEQRLQLPVIDGVLIQEIGGRKIFSCEDVRNIRGELCCRVKLADERAPQSWRPVIDGKLVEEVDGKKISGVTNDFRDAGGVCSGMVRLVEHDSGWRKALLGKFI